MYDPKATPIYNNYRNFTYDNVDDLLTQYMEADPAFQGVLSFVNYEEGIYGGCRFYETVYAELDSPPWCSTLGPRRPQWTPTASAA